MDAFKNIATHLHDAIERADLVCDISGKKYVQSEGWLVLSALCQLDPVVRWTKRLDNPDGFEAMAELRNAAGDVIASAEAQCDRDESKWRKADNHAIRSMAQTRAISKCIKSKLAFVVALAGYATTPAEEVPSGNGSEARDHSAPDTPADVVCPMGRNRGQPLGQMSSDDLVSMIDYLGDKVDDPKWGAKNKSLSDSAKAVLADRGEPFCPPTTF